MEYELGLLDLVTICRGGGELLWRAGKSTQRSVLFACLVVRVELSRVALVRNGEEGFRRGCATSERVGRDTKAVNTIPFSEISLEDIIIPGV